MKAVAGICAVALAVSDVTPIQKVIQLLDDMEQKGKDEIQAEKVEYAKYSQWNSDESAQKGRSIETLTSEIAGLDADIAEAKAKLQSLDGKIRDNEQSIAYWKGDQVAATKVRGIENAVYEKNHLNEEESVDALGRAIEVMSKQNYDRAEVLLQVHDDSIPQEARDAINAFLQAGEPGRPNAYEFQSGGIVDMLKKLREKFTSQLRQTQKTEEESKNSYKQLMNQLKADLQATTAALKQNRFDFANSKANKAEASSQRQSKAECKDADTKYKSELDTILKQKSSEFERRQKLRNEELEAINQARTVLQSPEVSGAGEKHLPQLMQSMLQMAAEPSESKQKHAFALLSERAAKFSSTLLAQVAAASRDKPFKKIKQMIQTLITKLQEEAIAETNQNAWCETELAKSKNNLNDSRTTQAALSAKIDKLKADIEDANQDHEDAQNAILECDKALAEATELRAESKAKNEQTVADAKGALAGVAQALKILNEFAKKAGKATALVQGEPGIWDSSYQGMQEEKSGVVGMLEVIASDFARLEAETSQSEAEEKSEHDQFQRDSATLRAKEEATAQISKENSVEWSAQLSAAESDFEKESERLEGFEKYFEKLRPTCVDAGLKHEEAIAKRKEEMASLKDALEILG